MTPLGYRIRRGHFVPGAPGETPEWSAHAPGYLSADHYQVCLVVTGDIVAASGRLGEASREEIVAAAQAIIDALPQCRSGDSAEAIEDVAELLAVAALDAARRVSDG